MPHARVALVVAVCLVAINMRPTITSVGPLLEQIGADTGLGPSALGLLASIPLATWALVSPFASGLSQRFGMNRVVLWSLALLTVGTVVRSAPGPVASLWIGTAVIGVALAVANVLMPAVIKREFPSRVPLMMAVYTALLGGAGAVASGVAVPVAEWGAGVTGADGWRLSLVITGGILLPVAIVAWLVAMRGRRERAAGAGAAGQSRGIWKDSTAWVVAAYMGFQSATFYILVTWLATIAVSTGRSAVTAGIDVMVYQIGALAGAIAVPVVLRGGAARWVPATLPVIGLVGLVGLIAAPDAILAWVLVLGPASGASLGVSLTLMAQRARDHHGATALSGMAQSVGYLMAAAGPVLFGSLHSATEGWLLPLVLVVAILVGQSLSGLAAGRERYVLEPR
ncbi:MAG: MFS transporter [Microbacterium sp. 67-17]|nr:MAG: MFS transporter [Microbacterium sp. 67-17]